MGGEFRCEPSRLDSCCTERVCGEWFCQGAECFGTERCPEVYQAEEICFEAIFSVSVVVDRLLLFSFFAFVLMHRVLFLFCSNPDALGIDDTVKDPIFASLKSITQLPPSPSINDDQLGDPAASTAESPATEEGEG